MRVLTTMATETRTANVTHASGSVVIRFPKRILGGIVQYIRGYSRWGDGRYNEKAVDAGRVRNTTYIYIYDPQYILYCKLAYHHTSELHPDPASPWRMCMRQTTDICGGTVQYRVQDRLQRIIVHIRCCRI